MTSGGGLTRREILTIQGCLLLYLLFQGLFVGLTPMHFILVALIDGLIFASRTTRQLAMALLPFILFAFTD